MIGETELIYREEQNFALWLRLLVALSMIWIVPASIVQLIKDSSKSGSPEILPILTLVIAGIFVPIVIGGLFWLLKLETEVRPDGLYVRYFPFHFNFKRFAADDLSEYYARKYRPIWEYGGSFQLHKVQLLDLACFPVWIGLRALRPVYVLPVQGEGSNL